MIEILLNGEKKMISNLITLEALLTELSYVPGTYAVAVNEIFVARSGYAHYLIKAGDRVEIVMPMQGG